MKTNLRVLMVLPAFVLGIGVGVGGTCLFVLDEEIPREKAHASGDAGTAEARPSHSAPVPEAITFATGSVGPADSALALERDSPRSSPNTDSEETTAFTDSNDALGAIRASIQNQSTLGKRDYLSLLQNLTPADAPKMIALFREMSLLGYQVGEYDRLFWQRWAEIDGAAASAAMFDRDKRFKETGLSNLAISTWAKTDPEAAKAWLFAQEDIPLREGMTKGLIEGMAQHDPAAAMRFLNYTDLSAEQLAHGYAQVARQYHAQQGLDSVGRWYGEISADDPDLRFVMDATTRIYSRAPFADALAWSNSLESSSAVGSRTRDQLHARLANDRPDGLLVFLGNEPGADAFGGVGPLAERAVSRWIQTNPGAMANWLDTHPEMRNYDLVAAPFVEQIASQDPEAAHAWAETLRDPDLRKTVRDRIASRGNGAR